MTTDQHANDALRALVREPVELSEAGLAVVLAAIPDTPQQRSSLPQLPTWRFQSMFSASKFVVAGAIVALYSGFLLAGVMTQPSDGPLLPAAATASSPSPGASQSLAPSPVTETSLPPGAVVRSDLLPGVDLVVRRVARGVYRILGDGTDHDLTRGFGAAFRVDERDEVWVFDDTDMFALGRPGVLSSGQGTYQDHPWWSEMAEAPDGTVWAVAKYHQLRSFDGSTWTDEPGPDGTGRVDHLQIDRDGRIWVATVTRDGDSLEVAYLEDGTWNALPTTGELWPNDGPMEERSWFAVAADGTVWASSGRVLLGYHDGAWTRARIKDRNGRNFRVGDEIQLVSGANGRVWAKSGCGEFWMARNDGLDWTIRDRPGLLSCATTGFGITIAPDGTPWLLAAADMSDATHNMVWAGLISRPPGAKDADGSDYGCPGVLAFKQGRWKQHLAGRCVAEVLAFAADGSVWVAAHEGDDVDDPAGAGLYVITPEAVAAVE